MRIDADHIETWIFLRKSHIQVRGRVSGRQKHRQPLASDRDGKSLRDGRLTYSTFTHSQNDFGAASYDLFCCLRQGRLHRLVNVDNFGGGQFLKAGHALVGLRGNSGQSLDSHDGFRVHGNREACQSTEHWMGSCESI